MSTCWNSVWSGMRVSAGSRAVSSPNSAATLSGSSRQTTRNRSRGSRQPAHDLFVDGNRSVRFRFESARPQLDRSASGRVREQEAVLRTDGARAVRSRCARGEPLGDRCVHVGKCCKSVELVVGSFLPQRGRGIFRGPRLVAWSGVPCRTGRASKPAANPPNQSWRATPWRPPSEFLWLSSLNVIFAGRNEEPQAEVAAVSDGERTRDGFPQHDMEERTGRVRLHFAATGTKAVKVDSASLSAADRDRLQHCYLDIGRI